MSHRGSQFGMFRSSPGSAHVCFNRLLSWDLLPRVCTSLFSTGARSKWHERKGWVCRRRALRPHALAVGNPSLCCWSLCHYLSWLSHCYLCAAALGVLDDSSVIGRLAGPFPAAGTGMLLGDRSPGRSTGHGSKNCLATALVLELNRAEGA